MASTTFAHLQIPLEDVLNATNNFHANNLIGRGDFGPAYKGRLLQSGKSIKIIARRLDHNRGPGDTGFWTEVSVLSDLKHPNLVSLIGFCDEEGEKIIITTYEAKGSLGQFLKSPNLTWAQRLRICVGMARALSYLHNEEARGYSVIHRNISSDTILLDDNWEPKLSCFEISIKQSVNRMGQVVLCKPTGTIGYMDPAIEKIGGVTHKSDIYSFGVVLFEILCERKAFIQNEANRFLVSLAKHHYKNETLQDIINRDLWDQRTSKSLVKYTKVAYSCLEEDQALRPDIEYIVDTLEKALERENMMKNLEHLKIRLSDIKLTTNNFSEKCSLEFSDGFTLYRAELEHLGNEDHSSVEEKNKDKHPKGNNIVIIKRYPCAHHVYTEEEFFIEIKVLTSVKHHNIATLLGFCVEGSEMIIVTKNVSNGYLCDHLKRTNNICILTWEKRLKICIDVAHALSYLHHDMEDQKVIINRDICSYNIGLDVNWEATIVNFWFSKFMSLNQEVEAFYFDWIGRPPYMDPEYMKTRTLKRESDVYSFGVVLFEILFGRTCNDPIYLEDNSKGLIPLARQSIRDGTLEEMIDPIIKEENRENNFILDRGPNTDSLLTFIEIASQCVAETQDKRPTMKMVVKELEKALLFQLSQEDRVQQPATDYKLEKKLERQLSNHEDIRKKEPAVPDSNTDQVTDNLEKALELRLTHEIVKKLKISLSDIQLATDNFSVTNAIAAWDGCTLYRGELKHFGDENHSSIEGKYKGEHLRGHVPVLIKRYPSGHEVITEEEFLTELEILNSVKHPNIVNLVGFCGESSEMIIVTNSHNVCYGFLHEYLENVNDMCFFPWEKRLKICIDVAHALSYLHFEMDDQKTVINFDCRIALDDNFGAKLASFWFGKFLPPNQEDEALHIKTLISRPFHVDPELMKTGKLKRESDVYSFGVVLFEMLCGRKASDPIYKKESKEGLAPVVRRSYKMRTLEDMIDPIIKEEIGRDSFILNRGPNKDSLHTFIEIANQCLSETQGERPTMKVVVNELEKALSFQKNNKNKHRISLKDISQATQNFQNCIGKGGYGRVYIGNLQDGDKYETIVAKRLDKGSDQGEKEFLTELQILLVYKHENVIGLVGYCDEQDEKILVYEYASRGSLDRCLKYASLTWEKRLSICIDVASALDFLHGGVGKQAKVIHRDIKTANILLNNEWKAKLADYGLSLISPINQATDYVIDNACGTIGYVDPLYKETGFLTIESDIYSFGVVLFEILYGRSTYQIHELKGQYLSGFIKSRFEEEKLDEVVFEPIKEEIHPKSLHTFQHIAYRCLHHVREKRPTTKEVLTELKKALRFQISRHD